MKELNLNYIPKPPEQHIYISPDGLYQLSIITRRPDEENIL